MPLIPLTSILAPGVTVSEDIAGFIPASLADHTAVYLVGTSASGPLDTPTLTISSDDFTNQFGVSDSLPSVKLFFANNPGGRLYFVRATTADATAPIVPTLSELAATIAAAFDEEDAQGFLLCPEGFQKLTTAVDKTGLANAMRDKCTTLDWVGLVDCSEASDTVAELQTEGTAVTSERGHVAFYGPYLVDFDNNVVPPSAAIAGLAVRRYKQQGYAQPPAGARFPVYGVKSLVKNFTKAEQEVLNPLGINLIRNLPNLGIVCWGARARSSSPFYRFVNTRVILNVLNGTLRGAFDSEIFSAVDGQGVLFQRIRETANAICYRLWKAGALYGSGPQDAFTVVIDERNNPAIDLENGIVRLDCYVVPSPIMERLAIRTIRTSIGSIQSTLEAIA
jgi:uncharacterized protein